MKASRKGCCAAVLGSLAVVGCSFSRGPSLTLPWEGWSFDRSRRPVGAASVVLSGGPAGYRGRAEIDVSDAAPDVARYFTIGQ